MFSEILNSTRNRKNPIKFLFATMLMKSGLCKYSIINRGSFKMRFFPSELSRELWMDSSWAIETPNFCKKYLKSGDIVLDVGANIGTVTLQASICVESLGRIYSIEPHPQIFKFLNENIILNNFENVKLFNIAVGNKSGTILFSNQKSNCQNKIILEKSNETIEVPIKLLDELAIDESEIDLLKIDVEGFEQFVLLGAKKTLEKTKCVYIETIEKLYNYDRNKIFEILNNYGFELFTISKNSIKKISNVKSLESDDIIGLRDIDDFINRTKMTLNNI